MFLVLKERVCKLHYVKMANTFSLFSGIVALIQWQSAPSYKKRCEDIGGDAKYITAGCSQNAAAFTSYVYILFNMN